MALKKFKKKPSAPKTRKQLRKEQRKNKKIKRHEYYTNRRKPGQFVLVKNTPSTAEDEKKNLEKTTPQQVKKPQNVKKESKLAAEDIRNREKKQQIKLQKEMMKQRKKQLLEANLDEDINIKRLEKQLKLHKRKSKAVPASFSQDGLDYLLEVCDSENLKNSALAEQKLTEINDEFEEDLLLMTESDKKATQENIDTEDSFSFSEDEESVDNSSESEDEEIGIKSKKRVKNKDKNKQKKRKISEEQEDSSDFCEGELVDNHSESENDVDEQTNDQNDKKSEDFDSDSDDDKNSDRDENDVDYDSNSDDDDGHTSDDLSKKKNDDGTWEDIYGRLRAKDGSIINAKSGKYIPPAARMKLEDGSTDKVRTQKLERLKKQLKGLINRLAESNMHSITTQIEELYMNNSRNDMNNTITNLIIDAIVSRVLAPERLLMEHVLLIAILHANVGTEVGAHFLETVARLFDEYLKTTDIENKKLDNIVIILAQLYNFKLFDSKLIYEILDKLSHSFEEKEVECILHILRNVGFSLRKNDPIALKNLILNLQKTASNASDELKNNSRVKFMLDILLAIKNNNVSKIPNYDTSYSEHLKKIMKGFIRKGNYVSQLNISLQDLLTAEEKGKWWVVGSAWTGKSDENEISENSSVKSDSFSQKLLELASKQRMNTDTRKNIFCIIMSAEDYLDAFEKLLRLALKNQQEREIIHVILHCCLQEKTYNPYYAALAQKFCEYDRKYQMTIKYSIWDKLKALRDHSATQISHLARLLSHLFIEKGLPISTLKIIQFSELDKITLRFIRQILLRILLDDDLEICVGVFEKVYHSDKLKMFRESLRLFLHHFLLRNLDSHGVANDKKELLQQRVKVVERLLTGKEMRLQY